LAASTVGIQTTRAPSRAATSSAAGLRPPTEWLSVMAPATCTSGTTRVTVAACTAVGM